MDSYAIPLDARAPLGVYQIEIGLYDPGTGDRLPLANEEDNLILTEISVMGGQ